MNLADAVAARRSVRSFADRPVPRAAIEGALELAVQAPAPHHSAPWRFAIIEDDAAKEGLARAMGARWSEDLAGDGLPADRIARIVGRSHALLTSAPVLVVCCADMSRAHAYPDPDRKLAEWSLFAHAVGAALQTFMVALAAEGIVSCWLSAPVFCRDVVRDTLSLPPAVEPHALILVGYPPPGHRPRPRPPATVSDHILG